LNVIRGHADHAVSQRLGTDVKTHAFVEWSVVLSLKTVVPSLLVGGVRVVALADGNGLRSLTGLVLIGFGFAGLIRAQEVLIGSWMAACVSVSIMAYGLLCDINVLVFVGVVCLYALGIRVLCWTMGQNTVTIICGITAVALGTMHLGMSYEAYVLTMQNVADESIPFSATLHALVALGGVETRLSSSLVRMFGRLLSV